MDSPVNTLFMTFLSPLMTRGSTWDAIPSENREFAERYQKEGQIYCACTNEIAENEWFKDVYPVKEILKDIKEILYS
jgi:hypothetical protein